MLRKGLKLFFFFTWCLSLVHCASPKKELESKSLKVAETYFSLFKQPSTVPGPWFQFDMSQKPLLFFSRNHHWIYEAREGQLAPLPFDQWQSRLPNNQAVFDFVDLENKKYLLIDMDMGRSESVRSLLHIILHEGFHGFYQTKDHDWKRHQKVQGRGEIYPLLSLPRYYRWEMHQSLLSYLETNNQKALAAYSYWYWKWKVNFPEEYNNYTDRIEGSAQYYSFMQMVRVVNQFAHKEIPPLLYFSRMGLGNLDLKMEFSLSVESYVIGTLAGLSLEKFAVKDWQKKVDQGESPLEILANQVKRQFQRKSNIVQNELIKISIKKMQLIDKDGKIDEIITGLADSQTQKVLINLNGSQFSSFAATGMIRPFFNFAGLKNLELVGLGSSFQLKKNNVAIDYVAGDYWISAKQNLCFKNEPSTVLIFKPGDLSFSKGELSSKAHPKFTAKASRKVAHQTVWYCIN